MFRRLADVTASARKIFERNIIKYINEIEEKSRVSTRLLQSQHWCKINFLNLRETRAATLAKQMLFPQRKAVNTTTLRLIESSTNICPRKKKILSRSSTTVDQREQTLWGTIT